MALVAASNFIVRLVWQIDLVLLLLILLLLLFLLAWRGKLILATRRKERLLKVWEPLLIESLEAPLSQAPPVHKRDWLTWLKLWNYFSESLKYPAREKLNHLARMTAMPEVALQLLRRGDRAEQMVAMTTLGQLREDRAWTELLTLAHRKDPLRSLTAAKALMCIDAARAVPLIIPLIASHQEWSATGIAAMLKEIGSACVSQPLAEAALTASPQQAPRLIRYLSLAWPEHTIPAIRQLLHTSQEPEVLTACLKVCNDPEALELVRRCLRNAHWQVRVQALTVLGKIGTAEDLPDMLASLDDREWWVRYRAAQALARLPGLTPEKLQALASTQASLFAHDAIRQAQAELQR